jgi:hypothetical protein
VGGEFAGGSAVKPPVDAQLADLERLAGGSHGPAGLGGWQSKSSSPDLVA